MVLGLYLVRVCRCIAGGVRGRHCWSRQAAPRLRLVSWGAVARHCTQGGRLRHRQALELHQLGQLQHLRKGLGSRLGCSNAAAFRC